MKMVLFEAFCHGMRQNQKPTVISPPSEFFAVSVPRAWGL